MSKYELLPLQLIHEGIIEESDLFEPKSISEEAILLTHDTSYWEKLKVGNLSREEIRKTGFPYSKELVNREIHIMGGTVECTQYALIDGVSLNVAGGTHHAFTNRGEGFCLLNDIAIATNYLLSGDQCQRVLIVDLDVHQGNGTAQIFANDPRVFTFSMHGERNYPLQKEVSDLDIDLSDGTGDDEYLDILRENLELVITEHQPDFAFYQSGVDVLATDKLGRLSLSLKGCQERDKIIFTTFSKLGIPVVASMGGGYSPDLATIVDAHSHTFLEARLAYG